MLMIPGGAAGACVAFELCTASPFLCDPICPPSLSPMQRGLEQRQFNLQHAPPRPQDPPATRASPRWSSQFQPDVDRGFCFGGRHVQLSRGVVPSSTIPCSRNLALCALDPPPKGPTALATRLGGFKTGSLFSTLARSPIYHGGPPPECLVRQSTSPTCSSLLVLRPSFVPIVSQPRHCTRGRGY